MGKLSLKIREKLPNKFALVVTRGLWSKTNQYESPARVQNNKLNCIKWTAQTIKRKLLENC